MNTLKVYMGYSLMRQGIVLQTDADSLFFHDSNRSNDRYIELTDELYENSKPLSEETPIVSQADGVEVHVVVKTPYSCYAYCDKSLWEELKLFADEVKPTEFLMEPN